MRVLVAAAALVAAALFVAGAPAQSGQNVILENHTYECRGTVDLALVRVTIDRNLSRRYDGIHLNCSGRIGRIEVVTPNDGVKVHAGSDGLVIGGGFIRCHPAEGNVHQDGVQAMGGRNVTFRNVEIDCGGDAAFRVVQGSGGNTVPTDIVCDGCTLSKVTRNNRVVRVGKSLRSGVRNSLLYWCGPSCPGPAFFTNGDEQQPINENNTLVLYGQNPPQQPATPQLTICANRATTFDVCWPRMTGVSRFNFYRDGSRVSSSNNGNLERVRFGKLVGTHVYGVGAVQEVGEGRAEVTVTR